MNPNFAFSLVVWLSTCNATGRYGPNPSDCADTYNSSDALDIVKMVDDPKWKGVQLWRVPSENYYTYVSSFDSVEFNENLLLIILYVDQFSESLQKEPEADWPAVVLAHHAVRLLLPYLSFIKMKVFIFWLVNVVNMPVLKRLARTNMIVLVSYNFFTHCSCRIGIIKHFDFAESSNVTNPRQMKNVVLNETGDDGGGGGGGGTFVFLLNAANTGNMNDFAIEHRTNIALLLRVLLTQFLMLN